MMKDSSALRGRPQYILARGLLQKRERKMLIKERKEELKGDEYIIGLYLRQRVKNPCTYKSSREQDESFIVNGLSPMKQGARFMREKGVLL